MAAGLAMRLARAGARAGRRQLGQAEGPARRDAVRGAGVDDAGVGVGDQRHRLARGGVGQAQEGHVGGVEQAGALGRVLARSASMRSTSTSLRGARYSWMRSPVVPSWPSTKMWTMSFMAGSAGHRCGKTTRIRQMTPTPARMLLLPGWLNSGPDHWQSRWEALHGHRAWSRTTGCGRAAATGWRGWKRCCWPTPAPRCWWRTAWAASWWRPGPRTRAHGPGGRRAAGGAARHRARRHAAQPADLARRSCASRCPLPACGAEHGRPVRAMPRTAARMAADWGSEIVEIGPRWPRQRRQRAGRLARGPPCCRRWPTAPGCHWRATAG
jgi:hypothetical protein